MRIYFHSIDYHVVLTVYRYRVRDYAYEYPTNRIFTVKYFTLIDK